MAEPDQTSLSIRTLSRQLLPAFIFVLLFSAIMAVQFWPKIAQLELWDNDDYMRYVQFTMWLDNGDWYLRPLERFYPQGGQIMHWTRVADIPLGGLTLFLGLFTDRQHAVTAAMSLVPSLYMLITVLALSSLVIRMFGQQYAFVTLIYTIASTLLVKFIPGSIDHHNIQLAVAALFLAFYPLTREQAEQRYRAWVQGGLLALSLWIGVGSLSFYLIYLFVFSLFAYFQQAILLYYLKRLCLSALICGVVFLALNRPLAEFFIPYNDAISILFLSCLLTGVIFCHLSIHTAAALNKHLHPAISYLLTGITAAAPTLILFPEIFTGAYIEYPEQLKHFWLDHVTEAKPALSYIKEQGLLSSSGNFILAALPALAAYRYLPQKPLYRLFFLIFLLNILPPLLWQNRTVLSFTLISIPLQAFFAVALTQSWKHDLAKAGVILLLAPFTLSAGLASLTAENKEEPAITAITKQDKALLDVLKNNQIKQTTVLAPIEYGSMLLAKSDNRILSAPYHRNIEGNKLVIDIFTSTDLAYVKRELNKYKIGAIVIGEKKQSRLIEKNSQEKSFANSLLKGQFPRWIIKLDKTSSNEHVFKVILD